MIELLQMVQQALTAARPGARLRFTIEVDVPGGDPPTDGDLPGLELAGDPAAAPEPELRIEPARQNPAQRLRAYMDHHGDVVRKESEWGADVSKGGICLPADLSAREIARARRMVPIATTEKLDGLDAGAVMIRASDLLSYLELRERVRAGEALPPAWWQDVVQGRHQGRVRHTA
jgi:hypothetical protein